MVLRIGTFYFVKHEIKTKKNYIKFLEQTKYRDSRRELPYDTTKHIYSSKTCDIFR